MCGFETRAYQEVLNEPRSENGEGGGAPTAALWALSVSARDGKIPTVRHDALDLISSRCQLFFAHDKLSRATLGWAAARWRWRTMRTTSSRRC